jgi:hypothetical protein
MIHFERMFASRGLRVRVPLAPPLVEGLFPSRRQASFPEVQQTAAAGVISRTRFEPTAEL